MIILDAEDLAEGGIKAAYDSLLPKLRQYVAEPWEIVEQIDDEAPRYSVVAGGQEYVVYEPGSEEESWGKAAVIFFTSVNGQLGRAGHRLYAINGGNDMGGLFLSPKDAEEARKSLSSPTDWPYIPVNSAPWYGQFH